MIRYFLFLFLPISFVLAQNPLPAGGTAHFMGSGNCQFCHFSDGGNVLTHNGVDVSPPTLWRSSMMANASKDPFWRAVVEEETNTFPLLKDFIETTCNTCHAPLGYTEAKKSGEQYYTMAQVKADFLANDGVTCTVCHQIEPSNFGSNNSYSGKYSITNDRIIYGPYPEPFTQPMAVQVNYLTLYSDHVNKSELCATCHTLFTPVINDQNQIVGTFPEQTPYLEWKNSVFNNANVQCQTCHMPAITDSIDISAQPPWHTVAYTPFWRHEFVGGNVFMLKLLRDNIDSLGLTASAAEFDSTIKYATTNLKEKAASLSLTTRTVRDTLFIDVRIINTTGHKLPSGIPFRRIFVNLKVKDQAGIAIFESGKYDENGVITSEITPYEEHHAVITSESQTQIYEAVLKDLNGNVTHTLLKANGYLKDNRLPPIGFRSDHPSYDSTGIFGEALADENFNKNPEGVEGTGSDIVSYIVILPENGSYDIEANLMYQSIKPQVVDNLSHHQTPDIMAFKGLYDNADKTPILMATATGSETVTSTGKGSSFFIPSNYAEIYPNPVSYGMVSNLKFSVIDPGEVVISLFDITGSEVSRIKQEHFSKGEYNLELNTGSGDLRNLSNGVYFIKVQTISSIVVKKLMLVK